MDLILVEFQSVLSASWDFLEGLNGKTHSLLFWTQKGTNFVNQTHMHLNKVYHGKFAFCSCCNMGSSCNPCRAWILSSVACLVPTSLRSFLCFQSCLRLFTQSSASAACRAPHVTQAFQHRLGNMTNLKRCIWRQLKLHNLPPDIPLEICHIPKLLVR